MKDENSGIATEEFLGLELKLYSLLGNNNNKHRKSNKTHNEYKDKCLWHLMNNVQNKE